jgi:hypothetical protein
MEKLRCSTYVILEEVDMKVIAIAAFLACLLATTADAQVPVCRDRATGKQIDCKKNAIPKRRPGDDGSLTPADKELLDRARTRSLLEGIEGDARRRR